MAPYCFPIILSEGAGFSRDEFSAYLERNGIDTRSLFLSMPTQCAAFAFLGHKLGEFPEAEFIGKSGLHVGVHQDITAEHMDYLIEITEKFLGTK
jgi:dTDP-4-amino-4,6-dideoxygalactose transaminase